jgi:hypothetical protein
MELNELLLVVLAVSVCINVQQVLSGRKAKAALVRALGGLRTVREAVERKHTMVPQELVDSILPSVLSMDKLTLPNAKKRLVVASTYLQDRPGASYRAVVSAIDEACRQRKVN